MSGTQVPANSYAESSYSKTVPSTCKVRTSQKPVCRMQTEEHRISPARDHFQISNTSHCTVATGAADSNGLNGAASGAVLGHILPCPLLLVGLRVPAALEDSSVGDCTTRPPDPPHGDIGVLVPPHVALAPLLVVDLGSFIVCPVDTIVSTSGPCSRRRRH